jgi:paraquat-inducible protein B
MNDLPTAEYRPRRRWSWPWLLPLLALCVSGYLFHTAWSQRGLPLRIGFQQGHGLKAGDALRYRGIEVGRVQEVVLSPELGAIEVRLRLDPSARDLARVGSRFWIVRPQVDLSGASGLETLVGANYLGVLPGTGAPQREFVGLETPPLRETLEPGGLEVVVHTPNKGSLRPGAPVSYRQVVVGTLLDVELAPDASAVEAHLYIKPEYRRLIRQQTRFWRVAGARLDAGWLSGLRVQIDSVQSLLAGGILLAIPPEPGAQVQAGHRFPLAEEPQPEWLQWTSYLDVRGTGGVRPRPLRAELRWRESRFFIPQGQQRAGWLLPVEGGLVGPADLLQPPAAAHEGAELLLGELVLSLTADSPVRPLGDGLALLPYQHPYAVWPEARRRRPETPEDALAVAGEGDVTRFVPAAAWQKAESGWPLDPAQPFDAGWHGAPVVGAADGALLGVLLVEGATARLAPLSP